MKIPGISKDIRWFELGVWIVERKYDVKLERKYDNNISVRFYSTQRLDLTVKDVKAFYKPAESDRYNIEIIPVWLDNDAKIKTFSFPKAVDEYTSLTFIIKDKTNKTQFAVQIPLNGNEVKYTKMFYEGV